MMNYPRHPNQSVGNPYPNLSHPRPYSKPSNSPYSHRATQSHSQSPSYSQYRNSRILPNSANSSKSKWVDHPKHQGKQQQPSRKPLFHSIMSLFLETEPQPYGFNYILYRYVDASTEMRNYTKQNGKHLKSSFCFGSCDKRLLSTSLFHKLISRCFNTNKTSRALYKDDVGNTTTASIIINNNERRSKSIRTKTTSNQRRVTEGSIFCFLSLIFGRRKRKWEEGEEEDYDDDEGEGQEDQGMIEDTGGGDFDSDEEAGWAHHLNGEDIRNGEQNSKNNFSRYDESTILQESEVINLNNHNRLKMKNTFTITIGPHWPGLAFLIGVIITISSCVISSKAFQKLHILFTYIIYMWSTLVLLALLQCALTNPGYITSPSRDTNINLQNVNVNINMAKEIDNTIKNEDEMQEVMTSRNKRSLNVILEKEEEQRQHPVSEKIETLDKNEEVYEEIEHHMNQEMENINENLIFCEFCKEYFPRDFYHCIDCGCCIERLDHHCPWIGRCIGAKNMKYFIRFNILWITEVGFVFMILFQDSS